jgi:aminoglycoside 3-N-acetyltransferase
MSEGQTIHSESLPNTRVSLASEFKSAGIYAGMTLLVHSSLKSMGWVCGGPVAVIQAIMDVLTPEGTLVMPTHSGDLSDPENWVNPPVPESWQPIIRENMPAFDPAYTPLRGMGRIPEVFRTMPGVRRSNHPALSFAAWGKYAGFVTDNHSLEHPLGEKSPLARVYDLDGKVLLLGVGHGNNTSFHLAEERAPGAKEVTEYAPILIDGRRVWKEYRSIDYDDSDFSQIGAEFEQRGAVKVFKLGKAETRLFSQQDAVDFAQEWIWEKRKEKNQAGEVTSLPKLANKK